MPQVLVPSTPAMHRHSGSGTNSPSPGRPDELLLRKERALQKRQFRKRIAWDVGVWALFIGGGAGFVWAVGRLVRRW